MARAPERVLNIKVVQDNMAKLESALLELSNAVILVGIPEDKTQRQADEHGKAPLTNAQIGYIHEHGAPEINLPARPWLYPGVESVRDTLVSRMEGAGRAALRGSHEGVNRQLVATGEAAVAGIRNYIAAGIAPPLSPVTVANRMHRTKGSSYSRKATPAMQREFNEKYARGEATMAESPTTPLIDTGQLIHAITWVRRDNKKKRL